MAPHLRASVKYLLRFLSSTTCDMSVQAQESPQKHGIFAHLDGMAACLSACNQTAIQVGLLSPTNAVASQHAKWRTHTSVEERVNTREGAILLWYPCCVASTSRGSAYDAHPEKTPAPGGGEGGGADGGGGATKWRGVTPLVGNVGHSAGWALASAPAPPDDNRHERTLLSQLSVRAPYLSSQ